VFLTAALTFARMKAGFVSIFGKPNAGKSTLLNAVLGEKLAIISPKVQTTRHRIKGILTDKDYQIIISDTPGVIQPKYKLQEKMMHAVKVSLEDADLAILLVAADENPEEADEVFSSLSLKVPSIVVINKTDAVSPGKLKSIKEYFVSKSYSKEVIEISALLQQNVDELLTTVLKYMPEGEPFFENDDISDLPTRFFVAEMIREKIYHLYEQEIPYETTVQVGAFEEKTTLTKIIANIIVQRESQKGIILGEGGKMIKKLGSEARKDIETFIGRKVFLELFVKVRPKWRDNELFLKEYGYG
jgi:GTP-binding protein Era